MRHAILVLALLASTPLAAGPAGLTDLTFAPAHQDEPVRGVVWYPAEDGTGTRETFAQNPVFQGVEAWRDAAEAEGPHPVVLLSHGMGGAVQSTAWLGAALAERGAVVIAVSHPGTTFSDFDLSRGIRHWTRAQDLGAALDAVIADGPKLDLSRVVAAGFSYGGWTALSLGGMTADHAGFVAHCEAARASDPVCAQLMAPEVDLRGQDPSAWDASYADARVDAVVAIDPGLVWGLSQSDVAALAVPATLIGLGHGASRLPAANFDASGLAGMMPDATVDRIVPGTHFSAMPLCTGAGAAILAETGDDPVCTDPEGADRAAIHARIVEAIATAAGL
ncbi:alpha/beta hydrolase family protein [Pseudaestuariivita atlantica]|uniref:Serine aminopeptidase S33 domain-containing protein n=1 Tax=Pseudaestuariivita atlantica TaxID=1317121 RepID=A0A0L1JP25_9RHOB|nr:alpha/beta hydrolase [Pseudaestuariivita atlantica]KNG93457.1 hypothetical protein ATO11_09495 [Pseudaestuariivita atlantica]